MGKIKEDYTCSLILTHDLIGGKWKLRILWHIINGDIRFSMLQKGISDITHKVLSEQLKELEEAGIITRTDFLEMPKRVEYSINESCLELVPIIEAICTFTKYYAKKNNINVKVRYCLKSKWYIY